MSPLGRSLAAVLLLLCFVGMSVAAPAIDDARLYEIEAEEMMKRSPYASPLIRFGKRDPMFRELRNQGPMMDPLIRFGKRAEKRIGASPFVRFGKRSDPTAILW